VFKDCQKYREKAMKNSRKNDALKQSSRNQNYVALLALFTP